MPGGVELPPSVTLTVIRFSRPFRGLKLESEFPGEAASLQCCENFLETGNGLWGRDKKLIAVYAGERVEFFIFISEQYRVRFLWSVARNVMSVSQPGPC